MLCRWEEQHKGGKEGDKTAPKAAAAKKQKREAKENPQKVSKVKMPRKEAEAKAAKVCHCLKAVQ